MHLEWYLPGPPLDLWLASTLAGARVCVVIRKGAGLGVAGRRARRWVRRWSRAQGPREAAEVVLVLTSFADPGRDPGLGEELAWLRPGMTVIEIAHHARGSLVRPRRRARRARAAGLERARAWLRAGLVEPVQWSPVDPHGVLVTWGRLCVAPADPTRC